jgi:hypothetical protein
MDHGEGVYWQARESLLVIHGEGMDMTRYLISKKRKLNDKT